MMDTPRKASTSTTGTGPAHDESRRYTRYIAPPVLINVSRLAELQAVAHFAEFSMTFADAREITIGSLESPRADPRALATTAAYQLAYLGHTGYRLYNPAVPWSADETTCCS